jgi:hypothetical protein
MNITPHFSTTIKAILKSYITNPEPQVVTLDPPLDLQKLANDLNLLPMMIDMGGCYGIRPNGDIFSFAWDEPHNLQLENNSRIRNIVLFQGSKKYPELAGLVPVRPVGSVDCSHCHVPVLRLSAQSTDSTRTCSFAIVAV